MDTQQAAAYVAGLFDGEGHVSKRDGRLEFSNTDPALIVAYCACLDTLGIRYRVRERRPNAAGNPRGTEVDVVRRASLQRFYELVPIRAPEKRARLERFVVDGTQLRLVS